MMRTTHRSRPGQTTVEYMLVISMITLLVVAGYVFVPGIVLSLQNLGTRATTLYTDGSLAFPN
jgi:Flp pilus assembly pilin Flp